MAIKTRSQLIDQLNAKVLSGGRRTTAQNVRDFENDIIESLLNKVDDADVNGGYLAISSTGLVDVSFIKEATPTGKFLRDDGSWQTVSGGSGLPGTLAIDNKTGEQNITSDDGVTVLSIFNGYAQIGLGLGTGNLYLDATNAILAKGDEGFYVTDGIAIAPRRVQIKTSETIFQHNVKNVFNAPDNNFNGKFQATTTSGTNLYNLDTVVGYEFVGAAAAEVSSNATRTKIQHDLLNEFVSSLNRFDGKVELLSGSNLYIQKDNWVSLNGSDDTVGIYCFDDLDILEEVVRVYNGGNGLTISPTVAKIGSDLLFPTSAGIDSSPAGTLNIGATNAGVINYGNASTVHNFLGTAIYELQVNAYVEDKLMTLNYGGAVASGIGVGYEIEENNVITGYQKTNSARSGWSFKAPANTDYTDLVFTASVPRTKTFQDTSSTIAEYGNKLSVFAATTSAELASVISDETGSGALVFADSPSLISPTIATSITGSYLTPSRVAIVDISRNIVSADTATYPNLTELSYTKGLTSSAQTQLDNKKFTISFESGSFNPADSTTYYFSDVRIAPNTNASNFSFNLGYAYTIIGIKVGVAANSTAGSTENSTLQIRNITQATSSSVGTFTSDGSSTLIRSATFTGLNISVAAGDSIACQWDTPAWGTNPQGPVIFATLICKAA